MNLKRVKGQIEPGLWDQVIQIIKSVGQGINAHSSLVVFLGFEFALPAC